MGRRKKEHIERVQGAVKTTPSHKRHWNEKAQGGLARKAELGNTNTPFEWALSLVREHVGSHVRRLHDLGSFLEPAVGVGNFYHAVLQVAQEQGLDPYQVALSFVALDKDEEALGLFKRSLQARWGWSEAQIQALPIRHEPEGLVGFDPEASFALIVMNPPYLAPIRWGATPEARSHVRQQWLNQLDVHVDVRADMYVYFQHWAHQHLAMGGQVLCLCSDSWVEADFGKSLREAYQKGFQVDTPNPTSGSSVIRLTTLQVWPWASGFRDDTSPILTLSEKVALSTGPSALNGDAESIMGEGLHWILDEGDPLSKSPHAVWSDQILRREERTWNPQEAWAWLDESTRQRRLKMIWPHALWEAVEGYWTKPGWIRLGHQAIMDTFAWSIRDLHKTGALVFADEALEGVMESETEKALRGQRWETEKGVSVPVCFQKQARTNRSLDSAPLKSSVDWKCGWHHDKAPLKWKKRIQKHGFKTQGLWLGIAMDRFPQWIWASETDTQPWVGVSKYIHWQAKPAMQAQCAPIERLWAAVGLSTVGGLCLERFLKEGTRKSQRKGEKGYVKEISKMTLEAMLWPDVTRWSLEHQTQVLECLKPLEKLPLRRWDECLSDEMWLALDAAVMRAMGWSGKDAEIARQIRTGLHWRRLRSLKGYRRWVEAQERNKNKNNLQGLGEHHASVD